MKVLVNGDPLESVAGSSLADLLQQVGIGQDRVAVERNGAIVPKAGYDSVQLMDGDKIEIVQFVGGG